MERRSSLRSRVLRQVGPCDHVLLQSMRQPFAGWRFRVLATCACIGKLRSEGVVLWRLDAHVMLWPCVHLLCLLHLFLGALFLSPSDVSGISLDRRWWSCVKMGFLGPLHRNRIAARVYLEIAIRLFRRVARTLLFFFAFELCVRPRYHCFEVRRISVCDLNFLLRKYGILAGRRNAVLCILPMAAQAAARIYLLIGFSDVGWVDSSSSFRRHVVTR